jgi:hypothetical protein
MDIVQELATCLESLPSDLLLYTVNNDGHVSLYYGTFVAEISLGSWQHAYRVSLVGGSGVIAAGHAATLEDAVGTSVTMLKGLRTGVHAAAATVSC